MNNNSSNVLVDQMKQYVDNISFQQQLHVSPSNGFKSSTPTYQQQFLSPFKQQQQCFTPNNTQILFSNSYFEINSTSSSTNNSYEQYNTQQRPITKKLSINTSYERSPILNTTQASSFSTTTPPSSYISSTTPPSSSLISSTSFSPYSTGSDSNQILFNNSPSGSPISGRKLNNKRTPKKVLPIRSDAIDMTQHIENAKKLKQINNKILYCTFCRTNGESEDVYTSHILKDSTDKISCPILRKHICPICAKTGDDAHTMTYCSVFNKSRRQQYLQKAINQISKQ
jgi:hypothetical protein